MCCACLSIRLNGTLMLPSYFTPSLSNFWLPVYFCLDSFLQFLSCIAVTIAFVFPAIVFIFFFCGLCHGSFGIRLAAELILLSYVAPCSGNFELSIAFCFYGFF